MLLYLLGFICVPIMAWSGRWVAHWIAFAMMGAATLYAWLFPSLVELGSHGSANYMMAWGMAIIAPILSAGCLVAGGLSFMFGTFGVQRREARERAEMPVEGERDNVGSWFPRYVFKVGLAAL